MRVRGSHIIVAVLVGISLFIFFAIGRTRSVEGRVDVGDPEFYESVPRGSSMGQSEDGNLQGTDADPDKFPKIVLASDAVELNEISNSEKSVHEFPIANEGEGPLIIRQIQTTCACTQGFMHETNREPTNGPLATIPPGQTRPMYIEIDPFRIPGWEATKYLTIWSNDPQSPQATVEVTSHVIPEFEISAQKYEFGRVDRGIEHKGTVLIRQITDEPFEVKSVRATGNAVMPAQPGVSAVAGGEMIPTFDLRVIKRAAEQWQTPGKAEWVVEIALSPSLPVGVFNGYYEIETTDDRLDRLPCSFTAEVASFFRVVPEVLTRRDGLTQGETDVGFATIRSEVPFTVSDLEVEGAWFSATAVPHETENSVQINVTADPETPLGPKSALIKMNVNAEDGRTSEHKLSVVLSVRPKE